MKRLVRGVGIGCIVGIKYGGNISTLIDRTLGYLEKK
jgi:hypothetical protein